jgi:hypothetical protein
MLFHGIRHYHFRKRCLRPIAYVGLGGFVLSVWPDIGAVQRFEEPTEAMVIVI